MEGFVTMDAELPKQTEPGVGQPAMGLLFEVSNQLNLARDADELIQVLARPAFETGAHSASLLHYGPNGSSEPAWIMVKSVRSALE